MEKRYQVFVSSTYEDLREERQEVMQALLELDCIPSGMELFPAASEDQWTLIKRVIDDCDYYIVIVGGRYGSIGKNGKSYTQMEYEYAVSKNRPVIAFLHANPDDIPAGKTEKNAESKKRLEEFRELAKKRVIKTWESSAELGSVVSRSIVKLMKDHPAVGWARANELAEELAAPELLRLRKQIEELEVRLQQNRLQAPEGTDKFAQGKETFRISFTVGYWAGDARNTTGYTYKLMWDTIFEVTSPLMIDRASESQLSGALAKHCHDELVEVVLKAQPEATRLVVTTSAESLRTIIVQLRALGLIVRDERQNSVRDTQTYWTLTPYGDNVMTALNAIPSKAQRLRRRMR